MSNIQYHSQRVDTLKDFLSPRRPQRYGSRSSAEHCLDGVSVGDPGVTRRNHILNYKAAEATFTSYEDFISLRPGSPTFSRLSAHSHETISYLWGRRDFLFTYDFSDKF